MHTSGFVALSVLILIVAALVLVLTSNGARRDVAHAPTTPFSLGR